jgi:hypothetical protein
MYIHFDSLGSPVPREAHSLSFAGQGAGAEAIQAISIGRSQRGFVDKLTHHTRVCPSCGFMDVVYATEHAAHSRLRAGLNLHDFPRHHRNVDKPHPVQLLLPVIT